MADIVSVLAALAQETRLTVLTLLARGPADGQTSGRVATQARVAANSMSTLLRILEQAGLVRGMRAGREIIYRLDTASVQVALSSLRPGSVHGRPTAPREDRHSRGSPRSAV